MQRHECRVGIRVYITAGHGAGNVGTIIDEDGRQYPIVQYGCTGIGKNPADLRLFTLDFAATEITALRERVAKLEGEVKRVEARLRQHPSDTPEDDKRDKRIAHSIALDALSDSPPATDGV